MSDPMRPANQEFTSRQRSLARAPDATYTPTDDHKSFMQKYKRLPDVQELLSTKRFTNKHAVVHNKRLHSAESVRTSTGDRLVTTASGPGVARLRSASGKEALNAAFLYLPDEHPYASKGVVKKRTENVVRFDGMGTIMTLNRIRKYVPEKGSTCEKVFGLEQARRITTLAGLTIDESISNLAPKLLSSEGPGTAIKISKHSYNGLPTEGYSDNVPAMRDNYDIARRSGKRIQQVFAEDGYEGVKEWYDSQRETRPYLTTNVGRAKDDAYSVDKYNANECRFYVAAPRALLMLVQSVTQAHAEYKKSIMDSTPGRPYHGFAGCSLAHGNAERLIAALQAQLDEYGHAFVVMGDDSQVFLHMTIRGEKHIIRMSLDCSSFDLTQRGEVMYELKHAIAEELSRVSRSYASLWRCMMGEKDIVIDKTLVVTTSDMGLSGMPYQAELNSCAMIGVILDFLENIKDTLEDFASDGVNDVLGAKPLNYTIDDALEQLSYHLKATARDYGFHAKVEDAYGSTAPTIKEQCAELPFQFVGYHFAKDERNRITVFCDVPRCLAQMPYPAGPKLKDAKMFTVLEACRLGGIVASMGVPPLELVRPFESLRTQVVSLLRNAYEMVSDMVEGAEFDPMENYANFLMDCPLGPELPHSVKGMLDLVLFNTERVWMDTASYDLAKERAAIDAPDSDEQETSYAFSSVNPFDKYSQEYDASKDEGNPFDQFLSKGPSERVVKATDAVVSVAQIERPPSKRTHGRPPPITTEAEVRARSEEVFRQHEAMKEDRKARRAKEDADEFDERFQTVNIGKISAKDQADLINTGYVDLSDSEASGSQGTIGSIEAADILMGGQRDPRRSYVGSSKRRQRR